jgi:hypothetical protein
MLGREIIINAERATYEFKGEGELAKELGWEP